MEMATATGSPNVETATVMAAWYFRSYLGDSDGWYSYLAALGGAKQF
jgi:hypothetical protein